MSCSLASPTHLTIPPSFVLSAGPTPALDDRMSQLGQLQHPQMGGRTMNLVLPGLNTHFFLLLPFTDRVMPPSFSFLMAMTHMRQMVSASWPLSTMSSSSRSPQNAPTSFSLSMSSSLLKLSVTGQITAIATSTKTFQ